jgi:hypothetical protein
MRGEGWRARGKPTEEFGSDKNRVPRPSGESSAPKRKRVPRRPGTHPSGRSKARVVSGRERECGESDGVRAGNPQRNLGATKTEFRAPAGRVPHPRGGS